MTSAHDHTVGAAPNAGALGALAIGLVALAGFAIRFLGQGLPTPLDAWWHDLLASSRGGFADVSAQILNVVGGMFWVSLITSALVAALLLAGRWRDAVTIGLTVALASTICSLVKVAIGRPRPLDGVVDISSHSFPSGHTTTAAAIAVAVAIAFPRVWSWALASAWILVMAASRTYLLVHWLTDVVAAAVLGISVAVLVSAVVTASLDAVLGHEVAGLRHQVTGSS